MSSSIFNYVWQGSYFPPSVQSAPGPQFHSASPSVQQVNYQPTNSSCHQYVHLANALMSNPTPQYVTGFYLKIFNPARKKKFQLYTMRNLSLDIDSPDKLKNAISEQYGDLLPPVDKMDIEYFHQGKNVDQKSPGLKATQN